MLGVVLDNKHNLSEHVKLLCFKAKSKIGIPLRKKNLIPEKTKLLLFESVILPEINYFLSIRASEKRKLEKMQEKGLRAVFNDHTISYGKITRYLANQKQHQQQFC